MGLYVRDEGVNQLAEQARKAIGARTKTEAVRLALANLLQEQKRKTPFSERIRDLQARTLALGRPDRNFDRKAFTDEMWDDL